MNIKLIKAEIEKLSLMLSSWDNADDISAIERDIVLDKLKTVYDAVRFDSTAEQPSHNTFTPPIPPTQTNEEEQEYVEKEVEVELIFADDEFPEDILIDDTTEEGQESVSDFIAATVANAITDAKVELEPTVVESAEENTNPEPIAEPEPIIEPIVVPEPVASVNSEQTSEPEPIAYPEPQDPAPAVEEKTQLAEKPEEKHKENHPMDSLFNMDEVRRQTRSKHQRMMSIYNDDEPRQEKVVDISKIFNLDLDEPQDIEREESVKPQPIEPITKSATAIDEKPATLADSIPAPQTLADKLSTPTALAEDINHSRLLSLRDGIGLNDKFLMIRDLFNGDGEAYESAINTLDSMKTLDDCMIHIIENYAWNPDSEGSKFIMQLLERKLS